MANRRTEQELVIQSLKRAWIDHPELRLGEMIWLVSVRADTDVFTMTDKELLDGLRNLDCCPETNQEGTPT